MEKNINTRIFDIYMGNDENEVAAICDFDSRDYINKLFEECRGNDYELILDYFTTDEDGVPETHYWNIKMTPECCTYEVMFNEHFVLLMDKFKEIAEYGNPEGLFDDLRKVYNQYLKPLTSDDKVKEAYERYEQVGDAYAAYLMTEYAQRLFKLMELGAPAIIINNEKRYFINAMIASSIWTSSLKEINIYTAVKSNETKHTIEKVGQYYGFSYKELVEKSRFSRSKPVSKARNIAMYICHEYLEISFHFIGQLFGDRDVTTVMHGCFVIEELLSKGDEIIANDIKNLIKQLNLKQ